MFSRFFNSQTLRMTSILTGTSTFLVESYKTEPFQTKHITSDETYGWKFIAGSFIDNVLLNWLWKFQIPSQLKPRFNILLNHGGIIINIFCYFDTSKKQFIIFQIPEDASFLYKPKLYTIPGDTKLENLIEWCFPSVTGWYFTHTSYLDLSRGFPFTFYPDKQQQKQLRQLKIQDINVWKKEAPFFRCQTSNDPRYPGLSESLA